MYNFCITRAESISVYLTNLYKLGGFEFVVLLVVGALSKYKVTIFLLLKIYETSYMQTLKGKHYHSISNVLARDWIVTTRHFQYNFCPRYSASAHNSSDRWCWVTDSGMFESNGDFHLSTLNVLLIDIVCNKTGQKFWKKQSLKSMQHTPHLVFFVVEGSVGFLVA